MLYNFIPCPRMCNVFLIQSDDSQDNLVSHPCFRNYMIITCRCSCEWSHFLLFMSACTVGDRSHNVVSSMSKFLNHHPRCDVLLILLSKLTWQLKYHRYKHSCHYFFITCSVYNHIYMVVFHLHTGVCYSVVVNDNNEPRIFHYNNNVLKYMRVSVYLSRSI